MVAMKARFVSSVLLCAVMVSVYSNFRKTRNLLFTYTTTNTRNVSSIDDSFLIKRDVLSLQQKPKSTLAENYHQIIQPSLGGENNTMTRLTDQLMNHALIYFPGNWDGPGIVMEEYKLIFFTQGKIACTVFKKLFRRMTNKRNWAVENAKLPHNPRENGLTYLYHYNITDALTILTHPNWTRAIFVRDPKERVLSAYLDKAARKKGKYVQRHCCNQEKSTCGEEANASFMGFLRVIKTKCCCDPHWISQTKRIDSAFRHYINFVGHFENIQQDTKRLLHKINTKNNRINNFKTKTSNGDLWEQYGASGWGRFKNESIFAQGTQATHRTSAITKLKEYYNASIEQFVENMFADDYDDPMFDFKSFSLYNKS